MVTVSSYIVGIFFLLCMCGFIFTIFYGALKLIFESCSSYLSDKQYKKFNTLFLIMWLTISIIISSSLCIILIDKLKE